MKKEQNGKKDSFMKTREHGVTASNLEWNDTTFLRSLVKLAKVICIFKHLPS